MWTRSARALAAALLAALALSGCGGESDSDDTANDPNGDQTTASTTTAEPTPEPDEGDYPAFEPENYSYTLRVSCFCPDAGVPVRVTVEDGIVSEAVYAKSGRGFDKGDPVPESRARTINDIIAAANDPDAESVDVDWPEGQEYPSEVYIDESSRIADEEVGYVIADVDAR